MRLTSVHRVLPSAPDLMNVAAAHSACVETFLGSCGMSGCLLAHAFRDVPARVEHTLRAMQRNGRVKGVFLFAYEAVGVKKLDRLGRRAHLILSRLCLKVINFVAVCQKLITQFAELNNTCLLLCIRLEAV